MHQANTENRPPQGAALYIHWPFCKKKCPYCDFNSHVREQVDFAAWRHALIAELRYWREVSTATTITSIFFGGGTPSLMPPAIVDALLREVHDLWDVVPDLEITLEANPTSVEAANFHALRAAGVNRVSLGVQSFDEEALKFLGREHSAHEARDAIALAAQIFPRYSFDLIYALPNQTPDQLAVQLREALPLARGHLSLYQLTIEQNTAFHHAYHSAKAFTLPEENHAVELYQVTQEIMEAAGLPAYEISNHAAPGDESRHNLAYWRGDHYLGIGPGAHGRVAVAEGTLATTNLKSPERWLESAAGRLEETLLLSNAERMEEKILMGLRLVREGFPLSRFTAPERALFDARIADGRLERLIAQGLLTTRDETLFATPDGQLVLNAIIGELMG